MGGAPQSRHSGNKLEIGTAHESARAQAEVPYSTSARFIHLRVQTAEINGDGGGCDLAPGGGAPCALPLFKPLLWTLLHEYSMKARFARLIHSCIAE